MRRNSLATELETCVRSLLPRIRETQQKLPTSPAFHAAPGDRPSQVRIVEEQRPNWWQLPGKVASDPAFSRPLGLIGRKLDSSEPFRSTIEKWISFPELGGEAVCYGSGLDMVWKLLTTYLTSAGSSRWNRRVFLKVWHDFTEYVDPKVTTVEHVVYAPVANMMFASRKLRLETNLRLERFSPVHIAKVATLDPQIAGVTYEHRFTLWPTTFLVQTLQLKKEIVPKSHRGGGDGLFLPMFVSRINDETVFLRTFLNEHITIPTYALLRFKHPLRASGGALQVLPWRLSMQRILHSPVAPRQLRDYQRLRAVFLAASGERGWDSVMASVRRFAIAWDNPFPADVLADLVAALEQLVVRSDLEVSYKLRVRAAFLLGKSHTDRLRIANNVRDAYSYRSTIFHGGYVFDSLQDFPTARRLKRVKGKHGNPFHDFNEVNRLTGALAGYYRQALTTFIRRGQYDYDWKAVGL